MKRFWLSLLPLLVLAGCGPSSQGESSPEASSQQPETFLHLNRFEIAERVDALETNRFFEEKTIEEQAKKQALRKAKDPNAIFYPNTYEDGHYRPMFYFDRAQETLTAAALDIKYIFNSTCYKDAAFTDYNIEEVNDQTASYVEKYGEGSICFGKRNLFHGSTGQNEITFYARSESESVAANEGIRSKGNSSQFVVLDKDGDYDNKFNTYHHDASSSNWDGEQIEERNFRVVSYAKGAYFTSYSVHTQLNDQGEVTSLTLEDFVVRQNPSASLETLYYRIAIIGEQCFLRYEHAVREDNGLYVTEFEDEFSRCVDGQHGTLETFNDPRNILITKATSKEELLSIFNQAETEVKQKVEFYQSKIPAPITDRESLYQQIKKANIHNSLGCEIMGSYAYDVSDEREINSNGFASGYVQTSGQACVGTYLLFFPRSNLFESVTKVFANGVPLPSYNGYFYLEVSEPIDYTITVEWTERDGAMVLLEDITNISSCRIYQSEPDNLSFSDTSVGKVLIGYRALILVTPYTGYVVTKGYVNSKEMETLTIEGQIYFTFLVTSTEDCLIRFELEEASPDTYAAVNVVKDERASCYVIVGESETPDYYSFVPLEKIGIGKYLIFTVSMNPGFALDEVRIDGRRAKITVMTNPIDDSLFYFGAYYVDQAKTITIEISTHCTYGNYSHYEVQIAQLEEKTDVWYDVFVCETLDGESLSLPLGILPEGYYLVIYAEAKVVENSEEYEISVTYNGGQAVSSAVDKKGKTFFYLQAEPGVELYSILISPIKKN